MQVQLQPLQVGGGDPDSPAGPVPPTSPATWARASGLRRGGEGEEEETGGNHHSGT